MPRAPTCVCGVCEKCKNRARQRAWYQRKTLEERRVWIAKRNPDKVRAADRARYERDKQKRRAAMDAYLATPGGDAKARVAKRKWAQRNRDKRRAQSRVAYAIRKGKLMRQPCEVCGARAHAHHDDYSKPLEVRWLCATHHAELHKHGRGA